MNWRERGWRKEKKGEMVKFYFDENLKLLRKDDPME